ncbi:MAG: acylphosphatase [Candidatus Hydrothermarchaeaceae archaeon]
MVAYKNYNIRIKGRVQDVGFRTLVENIAKSLNLRGMVYNDIDGTVKIVCRGSASSVKDMIRELKDKSANVGAIIKEISQEEIHASVDIPQYFFKAPTDELSDIGRKLDLGVRSIQNVEKNTDVLVDRTNALVEKTDSLVVGQEKLVNGQGKMIDILERIAEK